MFLKASQYFTNVKSHKIVLFWLLNFGQIESSGRGNYISQTPPKGPEGHSFWPQDWAILVQLLSHSNDDPTKQDSTLEVSVMMT